MIDLQQRRKQLIEGIERASIDIERAMQVRERMRGAVQLIDELLATPPPAPEPLPIQAPDAGTIDNSS